MMTFEQYQRRPVYMVQCFTCAIYRALGGRIGGLRCGPVYRFAGDQAKRDQTARVVRRMRRAGLTPRMVRGNHESILANPRGIATRVDIDQELERMGAIT